MSQVKQAIDFSPILQPIQRNPAFSYFSVVLSLDGEVHVLKKAPALPGHAEYVVVEVSTDKYHPEVSVGKEAGLAAINCGALVVLTVATGGTGAAAPLTGGTSGVLSVALSAGVAATWVSCGNSIFRTFSALRSPDTLTFFDNLPSYQAVVRIVEGVTLVGLAASFSAVLAPRATLREPVYQLHLR